MSKLAEISHEMLVLMLPHVLSRVFGFTCGLAVSMGEAAKPLLSEGFQAGCSVVLHGRALCNIPTCLITYRKCQNWRQSRTKCSFCCAHVSRLETLDFLWRRCVYGGSCKTFPFRRFPSRLSCRFAWQRRSTLWHSNLFYTVSKVLLCGWRNNALHTVHSTL